MLKIKTSALLCFLLFAIGSRTLAQVTPISKNKNPKAGASKGVAGTAAQKSKSSGSDSGLYVVDVLDLPPAADTVRSGLDANDAIGLLGTPKPFTLKAQGASRIIVYSSNPALSKSDQSALASLRAAISTLGGAAVQPRIYEITVPHVKSIDNFVTLARSLTSKGISIQPLGGDRLRLQAEYSVSDAVLRRFILDLQYLAWQRKPELGASRVFYLDPATAAAALNGTAAGTAQAPKSQTDDGGNQKSSAGDGSAAPSQSRDSESTANGSQSDNSGSRQQDAGQQDTSQSASGPGTASSESGGDGGKSGDAHGSDTSGDQPGNVQDSGKDGINAVPVNSDMLLFSGVMASNDANVTERKRILSSIDFPRPEILINTWALQASSTDPKTVKALNDRLRTVVGNFNDAIQKGIVRAWGYLRSATTAGDYFEPDFEEYVTRAFVGDSGQARLDLSSATISTAGSESPAFLSASLRNQRGLCGPARYCLGYTTLFRPLRPTLTDMLVAVIAARNPRTQIISAINRMEGYDLADPALHAKIDAVTASNQECSLKDEALDRELIARGSSLIFPMFCFREIAGSAIQDPPDASVAPILRAAIANFLFDYKLAIQYPHEFPPYDLSQSAQELNSELAPFIDAFNRDLSAFLDAISKDEQGMAQHNRSFGWAGHGNRFINNGIMTVRTISGKDTAVDAVTQSFFDATNPPSITDVINSIGSAEKNIPGVLKTNLSANQAAVILGTLNSVTPTQSGIGREFKLDITPHSLNGASSAELDVNLSAADSADPTLYSNGKSQGTDNLARVAKHTVETKVRLESIKLFEVSSFSALLQRSRRNFPLVPPFVEIPYIGSFISLPVPGAKEYHSSTAVMSAIVVPTAADLASGWAFTADRLAVRGDAGAAKICFDDADAAAAANLPANVSCAVRKAVSLSDVGDIRGYNKAKTSCMAGQGPYPGVPADSCGGVTLSSNPPEL